MVKRFINIILAIVLLVSTGGVTIYHHYCGHKLISTTIDVKPNDCCQSGCKDCRTNVLNLRVKTKVVVNHVSFSFKPVQIDLPDYSFVPVDLYSSSNAQTPFSEKDTGVKHVKIKPMLAEDQEAYLQVFII